MSADGYYCSAHYLNARCQASVFSLTVRYAGNLDPENLVITM